MGKWLRGSGRALLVAAACFTLRDVKNEGCRMYCVQRGYETGHAVGKKLNKCECVDLKDYDDGKPLSLGVPGAPLGQPASAPQPTYYRPYSPNPADY